MDETLKVTAERDDEDRVVVRVVGDLDAHSADSLASALDEVTPATTVVVDASGLGFVDSSGLRVLTADRSARLDAGAELVLRSPSARFVRLLELTGLAQVLPTE